MLSTTLTLRELQVLNSAVREASFSAAARSLSMTRAEVSRCILRLEQRLDLRLFARTTRQVVATEAARQLAARLDPALAEIGAALSSASEREHGMSGIVRLSCSHALGRHVLLPLLAEFRAAYPHVTITLSLSDRIDDLLARELDLSLRLGPLAESSMIARRFGRLATVLVAPPGLVSGNTTLAAADLASLPSILFRLPGSGEPYQWRLRSGDHDTPIGPRRVVIETDSIEAVAAFVRRGTGIALLPRYLAAPDLASGALVELSIGGGSFAGPDASLCYMAREHMPRRVRALCDMLIERLPPLLMLG